MCVNLEFLFFCNGIFCSIDLRAKHVWFSSIVVVDLSNRRKKEHRTAIFLRINHRAGKTKSYLKYVHIDGIDANNTDLVEKNFFLLTTICHNFHLSLLITKSVWLCYFSFSNTLSCSDVRNEIDKRQQFDCFKNNIVQSQSPFTSCRLFVTERSIFVSFFFFYNTSHIKEVVFSPYTNQTTQSNVYVLLSMRWWTKQKTLKFIDKCECK